LPEVFKTDDQGNTKKLFWGLAAKAQRRWLDAVAEVDRVLLKAAAKPSFEGEAVRRPWPADLAPAFVLHRIVWEHAEPAWRKLAADESKPATPSQNDRFDPGHSWIWPARERPPLAGIRSALKGADNAEGSPAPTLGHDLLTAAERAAVLSHAANTMFPGTHFNMVMCPGGMAPVASVTPEVERVWRERFEVRGAELAAYLHPTAGPGPKPAKGARPDATLLCVLLELRDARRPSDCHRVLLPLRAKHALSESAERRLYGLGWVLSLAAACGRLLESEAGPQKVAERPD